MKTEALEKDYDYGKQCALFAISIDLRCAHKLDPPLDLKDYCEKYGDVCPNDADYYYFRKSTGTPEQFESVFFELSRPAGGRFRDEDEVINATCMRIGRVGHPGGVVVGWEDVTDDEDDGQDHDAEDDEDDE